MSEANQEQQGQETPNVENEARLQGWVPKEEFRGDESDWIDANTFVQRGKEINPILRKNNERIQKELDLTKKQMEELRATTEEFKKFQKESYDRKLQEYEEQIKDLKELKKKAVSEGDGELVVELDDRIEALKDQKANSKPPEASKKDDSPQVDPEIQKAVEDWVETNKWYKTDSKLAAATDAIAAQVRKDNPFLVGKEFFDEVDKALADTFTPERLGKKTRPRGMVDSGGQGSSGSTNKKTYENLPPEAKQACDKFVKQKLMSREDYINSYDWS